MSDDWLEFERAVADFLAALDPASTVTHDAQTPDLDTGLMRQRDVWIETSFGGNLAIRILVSCKRKKSKISKQDMDGFAGELRGSGAHKGVLYSYSGFTAPALAKAKRLGISCCLLLSGRAPELPAVLSFSAYHFSEQARLVLQPPPEGRSPSWREILELPSVDELSQGRRAVDMLADLFQADDAELNARIARIPPPYRMVEVSVLLPGAKQPTRLILQSDWVVHRARMDSWLMNGSYSITDENFRGSFATPAIDTWSHEPGPGWERIDIGEVESIGLVASFFRLAVDVGEKLERWAADQLVTAK